MDSEDSIPAYEFYSDLEIHHDESAPLADIEDGLETDSGAAGNCAEVNSAQQFAVSHRVRVHEARMAPVHIYETPPSPATDVVLVCTSYVVPMVNCPLATIEEVSVPQKSFLSQGVDDARMALVEIHDSSTAAETEDMLEFTPSLVPVVNCPLVTIENDTAANERLVLAVVPGSTSEASTVPLPQALAIPSLLIVKKEVTEVSVPSNKDNPSRLTAALTIMRTEHPC